MDIVKKSKKNFFFNFFFTKLLKINLEIFNNPIIIKKKFTSKLIDNSLLYNYKKKNPETKWGHGDDHYQSDHDLDKNDDFLNVKNNIENYLNNFVLKNIFKINFGKFKIKNLWFVIMSKNTKHEIHSHPKSVLSGVYYLTDSAKSGGLKLLLPNNHSQLYQNQKQLVNKNTLIFENNDQEITKKDIVFYPTENDMIIFNSYIFHYVEEYKDNLDRLCIAWDAIYTV